MKGSLKTLLIFLFLFLILNVVFAAHLQIYNYSVTYVGIPVTSVSVSREYGKSPQTISAHATSSGIASAFFKVNNTYTSYCDSLFRPYSFKKNISQQNLSDQKTVKFQKMDDRITIYNNCTRSGSYEISTQEQTYDLISFAFAAAQKGNEEKTFSVISDFDIWEFKLICLGEEYIATAGEKLICDKYRIKMKKLQDNQLYCPTDVLTNNLFGEKNKLFVWYSADKRRIPVKMKFKKFLFNVVLRLEEIDSK